MAENERDKKKNELLRLLSTAERDGTGLMSKGQEITRQGQYLLDLARRNRDFLECIPDDSFFSVKEWTKQSSAWQNVHECASAAAARIEPMASLTHASDSSSVASSSIISVKVIASLPPQVQDKARLAYKRYEEFLEQSNLLKKIDGEIHRLGLLSASGKGGSILSLLKVAKKCFDTPSSREGSPSAVLIPLREAINCAIANLLQRRPIQEKTGSVDSKIRSICSQCSGAGIGGTYVEDLSKEARDLIDLLSEAKQYPLTRDDVRERMNRGLVFFVSFLRMLDDKKMRPR